MKYATPATPLAPASAELYFQITKMNSMIPKDQKYKQHYNGVQGDILRPPHGTTPAAVKINMFWLVRSFGGKDHIKETKLANSDLLSLFIHVSIN